MPDFVPAICSRHRHQPKLLLPEHPPIRVRRSIFMFDRSCGLLVRTRVHPRQREYESPGAVQIDVLELAPAI